MKPNRYNHVLFLITIIVLHSLGSKAQDQWITINNQNTNTSDNKLIGGWISDFCEDHTGKIWISTLNGISIWDGTNWESITTSDGIRNNRIGDIVEDDQHNIWISYGYYVAGASKFNGQNWEHFNENNGLINDKINSIIKDKDGKIWFATNGGLSVFDGKEWLSYTNTDGLPEGDILSLAQDTVGNILVGTVKGLWVFDGLNFTQAHDIFSNTFINELYVDNLNRIWVYSGIGFYLFDNSWNRSTLTNFGFIKDIHGDEENNIYVATSKGLAVYNNTSWNYINESNGLPEDGVRAVIKTSTGNLLLGFVNGMAIQNGSYWDRYIIGQTGLINNSVQDIFKDSNGNFWFCTDGGIGKYNGEKWDSFDKTSNGIPITNVRKGLEDNEGVLWFCSRDGIISFDGTTWNILNRDTDEMFSGSAFDIIQDKDNNIWIGTWKYLLKFNGNNWIHYGEENGFPSNYVEALYEDTNGNVWIGSRGAVSKWDGQEFTHYITGEDLPSELTSVTEILSDATGNIMAIGYGFATFKDGTWEMNEQVRFICNDAILDKNSTLWVVGPPAEGLIKFDGDWWSTYGTDYGLASNVGLCIYIEENGTFWIGTNNGISKIIPDVQAEIVYDFTIPPSPQEGLLSIQMASEGITQPYQYSVDNISFYKNEGAFYNLSSGIYEVYVTNAYDTLVLSDVQVLHAGVDMDTDINLKLYPNPIVDQAILEFPNDDSEPHDIIILDIQGNIVRKTNNITSSKVRINKSNLSPGIYIIEIIGIKKYQLKVLIK